MLVVEAAVAEVAVATCDRLLLARTSQINFNTACLLARAACVACVRLDACFIENQFTIS